MIEKDKLVAQTKEEMAYFKRELLNREENFNKVFSRQPNVGVMNTLRVAPPAAPAASQGKGSSGAGAVGSKALPPLDAKTSAGKPRKSTPPEGGRM